MRKFIAGVFQAICTYVGWVPISCPLCVRVCLEGMAGCGSSGQGRLLATELLNEKLGIWLVPDMAVVLDVVLIHPFSIMLRMTT